MKVHHGNIIEQKILETGRKKKDISERLGITRQTLSNKLKTPNLPLDFILQIGKILGYGFFQEIPELQEFQESVMNEPDVKYNRLTGDSESWKEKYMKLLEAYNRCLREKEEDMATLAKAINELRIELKNSLKKNI